jgi:hypothetical protein
MQDAQEDQRASAVTRSTEQRRNQDMTTNTRIGIGLACGAIAAVGLCISTAHAAPCNGQEPFDHVGWLDFLNYGPDEDHRLNVCGKVRGDNPNWGDAAVMGSNWNDRADLFRNNDPIRSVTIYQNADYNGARWVDRLGFGAAAAARRPVGIADSLGTGRAARMA